MHGGNFTKIINKLQETLKLSKNEKAILKAEYIRNIRLTEDEMRNILFSFRDIQKPPKHTSLLERNLSRTSTHLPIIQQPLTFPSLTNSKDKQLSHSDEDSLLSSQMKTTAPRK